VDQEAGACYTAGRARSARYTSACATAAPCGEEEIRSEAQARRRQAATARDAGTTKGG
jgi:hypothetical protein